MRENGYYWIRKNKLSYDWAPALWKMTDNSTTGAWFVVGSNHTWTDEEFLEIGVLVELPTQYKPDKMTEMFNKYYPKDCK